MFRATELAFKDSKGNKELVTCMTDAIALAIQGYHDMNNTWRQAMKKELNKDYAALSNSTTVDASSEFLFGNLSKLAKDITDVNRLTKKVRPSHQQGNYSRGCSKTKRTHKVCSKQLPPTMNVFPPDVGLIVGNQPVFKAGKLVEFAPMWREITSDAEYTAICTRG